VIIAVSGGRECSREAEDAAFKIGAEIANLGDYLLCGGYSGVMEAVCKGAKSKGGTTIGILMHEDKRGMNPYVDIPIATAMNQARNAVIVYTADIIIAVEGSYGTLSEIGLALAVNKPVIGFNTWDIKGIRHTNTVESTLELLRKIRDDLRKH